MATPNILSDISKLRIIPNVGHGTISSASAYAENMLGGSGYVVESNMVVRIVNLIVSSSPTSDSEINIALYDASGHVADLFTDYTVYLGNTVCLLDEASPIILEEGYTIRANSNNSECNYYIAYEKISNV
jgi:hypothetical protein